MLRIGVLPLGKSVTHPSSRRRLLFWAKVMAEAGQKIELIYDLNQRYNILFASTDAPVKYLKRVSGGGTPIILDIVDSLTVPRSPYVEILSGSKHMLARKDFSCLIARNEQIKSALALADYIVCPNLEIANLLKSQIVLKSNPRIILDSHDEFRFRDVKNISPYSGPTRMLWEGQTHTLTGLMNLLGIFKQIKFKKTAYLRVITDTRHQKYGINFCAQDTKKILNPFNEIKNLQLELISWSRQIFEDSATQSSFGLVPIDTKHPWAPYKPENRPLIQWRLGLSSMMTPIPSYQRILSHSGSDNLLVDGDWLKSLQTAIDDPQVLRKQAILGQDYILQHHSRAQLLASWSQLFEEALSSRRN